MIFDRHLPRAAALGALLAATLVAGAHAQSAVPPPPKGMGQIVFFRPKLFFGMAISFSIHEGDKGVAKLANGSYAVIPTTPGPHEYTTQFEKTDVLHVEVEEGETTYVTQGIGQGKNLPRPFLAPADEAAFLASKAKKPTTLTPTDLKPTAAP